MARHAIIVAAGKGERMGAPVPKQFIDVAGKPLLMRTVEAFRRADEGINIVLVLPEAYLEHWQKLCNVRAVCGAATRFHSVLNGLSLIDDTEDGLLAVHDGVRPFASTELIRRCFSAAEREGTAVPVVPVVESMRRIRADGSETIDRRAYRLVQTPQVFRLSLLREAYRQPYNARFTDDATVVEALGRKVCLVEGERNNIKVTTPDDLAFAEYLCRR
ncbi:MAG: 2-C-methyl-D-erythritol 4-phosphate cytidylyltransferase [Prevotellaceae bacterium]|nr:2-C-methyl-D-erythritol 4-phosphate cytidylyltransferase [Prevotellaceae bacterium]